MSENRPSGPEVPAPATLAAAMPGLVVAALVADGSEVSAGQPVLVTETMKCEHRLVAPVAGRIRFECRVGDVVEPGQVLAGVVPAAASAPVSPRVRSPRPATPAEVVALVCGDRAAPDLQPAARTGSFVELDLVAAGPARPTASPGDRLEPVTTSQSAAAAGVTVGLMTHVLDGHPDGVTRVWIGGDSSRAMGAVSEAECRRIIAAFDLAEHLGVPVEWVAVSAGARIAWDSGTENMDWCAAVVARIVQFTAGGGEVVVVVAGINVGAQSYWNAEATMLLHHAGMLVMVREHAMVLTGKNALALSGGGSFAADTDIGGYDAVMGPNGQAHHVAEDLVEAYRLVFTHHSLCTRRSDGTAPVVQTTDAAERDVCADPYPGPEPFGTVGEVLDGAHRPNRKQPFGIRPVMSSLVDREAPVLERWPDWADARGVAVWDSRIGGAPVTVLGIEARPYRADGHDGWYPGATLQPEGSRKAARAINAASGRRPVVVLASLSGFDGSARAMRGRQLEFGAEIARAVTHFRGPLVVVVLGRFHGGAYVVFSKALNDQVRIVALDGTFVSVIGGDAAAGVVFAGEVRRQVSDVLAAEPGADPDAVQRRERDAIARRFDRVHDVRRAESVGSVDEVVAPAALRPTVLRLLGVEPALRTAAPPPPTRPRAGSRRACASAPPPRPGATADHGSRSSASSR